jgi:hypothetical protein
MCCLTNAALVIFIGITTAGLVATVVALATPAWSSIYMAPKSSDATTTPHSALFAQYESQIGLLS